jgi:hypothetical protein
MSLPVVTIFIKKLKCWTFLLMTFSLTAFSSDIHHSNPGKSKYFIRISTTDNLVSFQRCEYGTNVCKQIGPKSVYPYKGLADYRWKQMKSLAFKKTLSSPQAAILGLGPIVSDSFPFCNAISIESGLRVLMQDMGGVLALYEKRTNSEYESKAIHYLADDMLLSEKPYSTHKSIDETEKDLLLILNDYSKSKKN